MTASNLAICVGPSLLWSTDSAVMLDQAYSKQVSAIAQVLVEDYHLVFGDTVPAVFADADAESDDAVVTEETAVKAKSVVVGRSEYFITLSDDVICTSCKALSFCHWFLFFSDAISDKCHAFSTFVAW